MNLSNYAIVWYNIIQDTGIKSICYNTGADPGGGGGGPGGQNPPVWGTPKLHKKGEKNVSCVRLKTLYFST